jgi:hypothetical protein
MLESGSLIVAGWGDPGLDSRKPAVKSARKKPWKMVSGWVVSQTIRESTDGLGEDYTVETILSRPAGRGVDIEGDIGRLPEEEGLVEMVLELAGGRR